LEEGIIPPTEGKYLVLIGIDKMPKTVYQVCSIGKVNSQKHQNRFAIEVIKRPTLLPVTIVIPVRYCGITELRVRVNGEISYPLFWYSRNKKNS
jgi:hypothetical protein